MAKLLFDQTGERLYETGVKECALYTYNKSQNKYNNGVAWNGITAITESPSGAEATALYADDMKYLNLISAEEFGATVEAYMYPDGFAACNGEEALVAGMYVGQQSRSKFAMAYKTTVGNATVGNDYGYKLHVVYNCLAAVSEKAYATINDSPEAITFSWEISTTPEVFEVDGKERKTAIVTIDTAKFLAGDTEETKAGYLKVLEEKLYGNASNEPTLLMPNEIYEILSTGKLSSDEAA